MRNEIEEVVAQWNRDNLVRNLSRDSMETYMASTKDFMMFFQKCGVKRFKQITNDVVKDYIASQQLRGCAARTINNRLKALRRVCHFYRAECKEGYVIPKFSFQREAMSSRTPCSNAEVYRIIENIKPSRADSVLVAFILETGVRSKTVRNIRIEDLDLKQGRVLCRVTKNHEPLVLPLCTTVRELLKAYIEYFDIKNGYLFTNSIGGQLYDRSSVWKIVTNFLKNVCGLERSGVHLFRYTFCRIMVENNCNPMILKEWLGHRTMEETKKYVRLYSDDLAQICEKVTPLARDGKIFKNRTHSVDNFFGA